MDQRTATLVAVPYAAAVATFTGCKASPRNFWGVVYRNGSGTVTGDSVVDFTPSPSSPSLSV